jgi:hypothetical protein
MMLSRVAIFIAAAATAACGAVGNVGNPARPGIPTDQPAPGQCDVGCLLSTGTAHIAVTIHDPVTGDFSANFDAVRLDEMGTIPNVQRGSAWKGAWFGDNNTNLSLGILELAVGSVQTGPKGTPAYIDLEVVPADGSGPYELRSIGNECVITVTTAQAGSVQGSLKCSGVVMNGLRTGDATGTFSAFA